MTRSAAFLRSMLAVPLLLLPAWAGAWYVGAGVGQTNNEYLPTFSTVNASIDDNDIGYKLFVGQQLGTNFAVELEYADLNRLVRHTAPGLNLNVESTTLAASVLGRLPVYPGWTMYGRLGFGLWNTDLDVNGSSGSRTSVAPVIGLGVEYTLQDRLRLGLEWEQYQNVGEDTSAGSTKLTGQNVDTIWLRLTYHIRLAPGP